MLATGTGLAYSSALGRLLDGLSALLGVCTRTTYEGQAPMELEAILDTATSCQSEAVPASGSGLIIDWTELIHAVLAAHPQIRVAAAMVHRWVANAFLSRARQHPALASTGLLLATGGCLQNAYLADLLRAASGSTGIRLLTPRDIPPGDGGLALGVLRVAQALINRE
jgi:hydrogenase maturation protein HypF